MKKVFHKIRGLLGKKEEPEEFVWHGITICDYGQNRKAFNEVVKMFSDELEKQLGIKINSEEFIVQSPFRNTQFTKFTFPIPPDLSFESKLLFDLIKKNVQLKIKGIKKYKDINLIGVKKTFIDASKISNLWKMIENDEQLKHFDGPLFLNLQVVFYTCVLDYDRFTNFAKKLDKYLDFEKVDYIDVKKRIIDAVDEATGNMHNKFSKDYRNSGVTKKKMKEIIEGMGEQGAVKLIYMRNYTWDDDNLKKKSNSFLDKLSSLMEFMQTTLESEGPQKDFLVPVFDLSTDIDFVSAYGCFTIINDKTGLDESVISASLPERMKEL